MSVKAKELHKKADELEAKAEQFNDRGAIHVAAVMSVKAKEMRRQAIDAQEPTK